MSVVPSLPTSTATSATARLRTPPSDGATARPAAAHGASALSWRALLLGVLLAPLVCYWIAYTQIRANSTDLVMMSLFTAAVFPLLVLLALNTLLHRLAPRVALSRGELLTIYVMLTSTVGLAGGGFVPFLAANIAAPHHYNENGWADWLPHLKPWASVADPEAVKRFYEGQSGLSDPILWRAWTTPILLWSGFLLTMLFWGYCLNTLLRRPWMDNEKLPFPIAQIPLEITGAGTGGGRPGAPGAGSEVPFWQNRLLWIGIALPVIFQSINSASQTFAPSIPYFRIKPDDSLNLGGFVANVHPWSAVGYLTLAFYPLAIGLVFLLPTDVSFSCWFFYLVGKAELVLSSAAGLNAPGASQAASRMPYILEQGTGAFLGLALLSLWASRRHLQRCWEQAWSGQRLLDDSDEPMSYRAAVFGGLAATLAMAAFATAMGITWYVSLLFFVLYGMFLITYTRIRAEVGLPWVMAALYNPHGLLFDIGGAGHHNAQNIVALGRFEWFEMDYRSHMMPNQLDAMKIARSSHVSLRGLSVAIALATLAALVGSWLSCLHIFYTYGATTANVNTWYAGAGRTAFDLVNNRVHNPTPTDMPRVLAVLAGAGVTAALTFLRTQFASWPFHPIGYVVANTWTMDWLWCPTLIAWLCKALVLRYGGVRLFRTVLPFFIGLVVGDLLIAALWTLLFLALNIPGFRTFPI